MQTMKPILPGAAARSDDAANIAARASCAIEYMDALAQAVRAALAEAAEAERALTRATGATSRGIEVPSFVDSLLYCLQDQAEVAKAAIGELEGRAAGVRLAA